MSDEYFMSYKEKITQQRVFDQLTDLKKIDLL